MAARATAADDPLRPTSPRISHDQAHAVAAGPSPHRGDRMVGAGTSAGVTASRRHQRVDRLLRRIEGARDPDDALAGGAAPREAVAFGDEPAPDELRQRDE